VFTVSIASAIPPSASIIIPARNEQGHIERIFGEMPHFCPDMELIFVEGNSTDATWKELRKCARRHEKSWPKLKLLQQEGKGKADAVWKGIAASSGQVIFILDADLTVPPESLEELYKPFCDGSATFTYGSRYLHPMEKGAMRFWNNAANRAFAVIWRPFFAEKMTDALCGTKVFLRKDYNAVRALYPHIFAADYYGDFALLFIAPVMRCTAKEIAVHYRARKYGTSNIPRWQGGMRLLRVYVLCLWALVRMR